MTSPSMADSRNPSIDTDCNPSIITGRLHSYETLGTLDGPGLRLVVFLQGCPLRCRYCHNPDTWSFAGGREITVAEIVTKAQRMKSYFGQTGGVTLSGGEPLAQALFTLELLQALQREGIHTALDTSGCFTGRGELLQAILASTDLVLLDIKHPDAVKFQQLTGQPIDSLFRFLQAASDLKRRVWIRQVIVPGLNDSIADIAALVALIRHYPGLSVARVELLGYHTLGVSKYAQLGLAYSLDGVPPLAAERLAELQNLVNQELGL
jgi:pyruvate formate lyase activating enzyme